MNKEKLTKTIKSIVAEFKKIEAFRNELRSIGMYEIGGELDKALTNGLLAWVDSIEDADWIDWYLWENDCGEKGLEAVVNGITRKIKTVDDLVWAITTEQESK